MKTIARVLVFLVIISTIFSLHAQTNSGFAVQVSPEEANGRGIIGVLLLLHQDDGICLPDSAAQSRIYESFMLNPGEIFTVEAGDRAVNSILNNSEAIKVTYELHSYRNTDPVIVVIHVFFKGSKIPK